MQIADQPKIINHIPVKLPFKEIYARLGYNRHFNKMTEKQKIRIDYLINSAYSCCEPVGVWQQMNIKEKNDYKISLENNSEIESQSLVKLLKKSNSIVVMAASVGEEIVNAISEFITEKDTSSALIYDATGSETADAILDWMQKYLNQIFLRNRKILTKRRFSPGYGDLDLKNQKIFYDILNLKELGIILNEKYILQPEKSVIAIAGLEDS